MTATEAEALRAEGEHLAEAAADSRVVAIIDKVIADACESGEAFSANDIRDALPTTVSPGLVGARFDAARKRGAMRSTGRFVRSTLASTRSARICVWRGVR